MDSIYLSSSGELESVIGQLESLNGQFENAVADIVSLKNQLVGAWTGQASEQFSENFEQDKPKFDMFHDNIASFIQALQQIKEAYEAAEEANVRTAQERSYSL